MVHEPQEAYDGPARLGATDVDVKLRGHFQPIDGRFHWWGRVAVNRDLEAKHASGAAVTITTPHGEASGKLTDVDPWGRFRVSGTGRPPF